jgi:predicted DNA-binding protein (MmcQ/YjbR family)
MKGWSAALETETKGWPQVSTRAFFGFTALYRRNKIFALLPRTRAMQTPNSLAFKLESRRSQVLTQLQQDPRVGATEMQKAHWFTFELTTDADLSDALAWLGRAYEAAGKSEKQG